MRAIVTTRNGDVDVLKVEMRPDPVPGKGDVLPHERTTPKALDDRLSLLRATRTNLSPVWGLSMAAGLSLQKENFSTFRRGLGKAIEQQFRPLRQRDVDINQPGGGVDPACDQSHRRLYFGLFRIVHGKNYDRLFDLQGR